MNRSRPGTLRNPLQRALHRWHRRIGTIAAAFVLLVATTGLLLSHAAALRLDARTFDAAWLTRLYGLAPQSPPRALHSAAGPLVWIDGHVYRDDTSLDERFPPILGLGENAESMALAGSDALLLLTRDGTLIERLDAASLPGPITAIGTDADGRIVLRSRDAEFTTDDFLRWSAHAAGAPVHWSQVDLDPDPALLAPALRAFRGPGVSAARLITDLHTGRFLGPIGPWLMDASAIALIVLAGSGFWMWAHRKRHRRH